MKNTLIKNIISNLELMDSQHFLDWFKENKLTLLEAEKRQIIEAHEAGQDIISIDSNLTDSIQYYENTFNTTNKETLK